MMNGHTKAIAIDTETTGKNKDDYPFAISLCDDKGITYYYDWNVNPHTRLPSPSREDIEEVRNLCKDRLLIFHNSGFDIQKLEMIGLYLDWEDRTIDTQVWSHVLHSQNHTEVRGRLKDLALLYLDIPDDDKSDLHEATVAARRIGKKKGWKIAVKDEDGRKDNHVLRDYWMPKAVALDEGYPDDHPWNHTAEKYAVTDAERTMLLYLRFKMEVDKWEVDDPRHDILKRENALMQEIYEMQERGFSIHSDKIDQEIGMYLGETKEAISSMRQLTKNPEFNVDSPIQLSKVLFEDLKFPILKRTKASKAHPKGQPSTDAKVRESLRQITEIQKPDKLIRKQLRFLDAWDIYKGAITGAKYLRGYKDLQVDGRLYPSLLQTGTATVRFSSQNPNGQNVMKGEEKDGVIVKRGLRGVFGPASSRCWFCLDYSQLQLRLFAALAKERSMIEAFAKGYDFHAFIASKIFNIPIDQVGSLQRRIGKNVNFGYIFGASESKIDQTAGIPGLMDTVQRMFPSAHEFMRLTKYSVNRFGYVTTPHGYRLYVDQSHKGVNYIIQGCEGDLIKFAMVHCGAYLRSLQEEGFTGYMTFQVHDELIFDFPLPDENGIVDGHFDLNEIVAELKRLMEEPATEIDIVTPVDVDWTTTDWSAVKKYLHSNITKKDY